MSLNLLTYRSFFWIQIHFRHFVLPVFLIFVKFSELFWRHTQRWRFALTTNPPVTKLTVWRSYRRPTSSTSQKLICFGSYGFPVGGVGLTPPPGEGVPVVRAGPVPERVALGVLSLIASFVCLRILS